MCLLGSFLFAVLLIALALLTLLTLLTLLALLSLLALLTLTALLALLDVPLARTIDILRTLCWLLFRLLITIRAARLLIHLVFIFHNVLP
jgi:hypothetical protein